MSACDPDRIQHIGAKVLISAHPPGWLDRAIPVFHRWIRHNACEELLIDVADYGHLPVGPGVILAGHEANYALDRTHGRPGLLYQRKCVLDGSFECRLLHSIRQASRAASRLLTEPEFQGELSFDFASWEIVFNDRLLAPNDEPTWEAIRPALARFFDQRFALHGGACRLQRLGEPRELLRVGVHLDAADATAALEQLLGEARFSESHAAASETRDHL